MHYLWDDMRKAYHCYIASDDIYIYSHDTPIKYLLKGYASLFGAPLGDDDDLPIDEGSLSDASYTFDDRLVNVHLPCSSCRAPTRCLPPE